MLTLQVEFHLPNSSRENLLEGLFSHFILNGLAPVFSVRYILA